MREFKKTRPHQRKALIPGIILAVFFEIGYFNYNSIKSHMVQRQLSQLCKTESGTTTYKSIKVTGLYYMPYEKYFSIIANDLSSLDQKKELQNVYLPISQLLREGRYSFIETHRPEEYSKFSGEKGLDNFYFYYELVNDDESEKHVQKLKSEYGFSVYTFLRKDFLG